MNYILRAWAFTAFDSADCRRRGEFAHEFAHVVHRSDDRSDMTEGANGAMTEGANGTVTEAKTEAATQRMTEAIAEAMTEAANVAMATASFNNNKLQQSSNVDPPFIV
jgi:hypothetical protein